MNEVPARSCLISVTQSFQFTRVMCRQWPSLEPGPRRSSQIMTRQSRAAELIQRTEAGRTVVGCLPGLWSCRPDSVYPSWRKLRLKVSFKDPLRASRG